jgi:hypothetical protein
MTDDTTVDAGSENSGETAAVDTAQADTTATDTSATATTDASADAGGAAPETTVKAGDACTCPDGRTGTIHSYDEGLICIPNADQG